MGSAACSAKIALLGAECTGKTQLASAFLLHLQRSGQTARVIPEYLREWCDQRGHTPAPSDQCAIAQEQVRRIDQAPPCAWLIADTSALMVAVYSDLYFGDQSLYAFGIEQQKKFDLTVVTALDLPWVADGLQRDGEAQRTAANDLLHKALKRAAIRYKVVTGLGQRRLANLLDIVNAMQTTSDSGSVRA